MILPRLNEQRAAWTDKATLPGGDIPDADFEAFLQRCEQRYPWMPKPVLTDYARNYGTIVHVMLAEAQSTSDLGVDFGGGLYELEVRHLMQNEWAQSADDVLWRRTRKGLHVPDDTAARLSDWMQNQAPPTDAS